MLNNVVYIYNYKLSSYFSNGVSYYFIWDKPFSIRTLSRSNISITWSRPASNWCMPVTVSSFSTLYSFNSFILILLYYFFWKSFTLCIIESEMLASAINVCSKRKYSKNVLFWVISEFDVLFVLFLVVSDDSYLAKVV